MKKLSLVMVIVVLIISIYGCTKPVSTCTEEAKVCPDGTTVGRTGPNCEFAPCPSPKECQVDSDCGLVQQCGMTWECSEGKCYQASKECPKQVVKPLEGCKDLCGDGNCQEIVCMATGCPCSETKESCPQDCAE